jgi:hypothetical protein
MSAFAARARPPLGRIVRPWSDVMDILFRTSRKQARRLAEAGPSNRAQPSGIGRLLLALAVIAAIVGLLGHASDSRRDVIASTVPSHLGAPK